MLWFVLALSLIFTPGHARQLTREQVCTTKWGLDRRHVTTSMKQYVAGLYGVPWADRSQYEFDHLVPRELGGADDVRNIWPQPWSEARKKDQLENRLHRLVCTGALGLRKAQTLIRTDWQQAYIDLVERKGATE